MSYINKNIHVSKYISVNYMFYIDKNIHVVILNILYKFLEIL